MAEYAGSLDGRGLRVAIVVARFNSFVTDRMLEGAQETLRSRGVAAADIAVAFVPGSFELPLAAKRMAESGGYHVVLCLGAVIRGETAHFDHVAGAAARGVLDASMDTGVPVIFGVLTTDTVAQARERLTKGSEAALAGIQMANLMRSLGQEK